MDLDVIFWLVVGGFYLFRMIKGKKEKQPVKSQPKQHPNSQPQVPPPPQPDVSHIAGESVTLAEREPPPAEIEIGQVLTELGKALGLGQHQASSPPPIRTPQRDAEVFGGSEERFEQEAPFHEMKDVKEERFEKRPAYFVPENDREEAFEQKDFHSQESAFHEDGFENRPGWSEVEFKKRWKGHESDFEYHSPLETHAKRGSKPSRVVSPPTSEQDTSTVAQQSTTGFSLFSQLDHVSDLQKAVLLHEILGPPISQRTQSPRRRPS